MKFHEEIYTSAPELLERGASHLGIVARSKGFPPEAEAELAGLRTYAFLDGLPLDRPDLHPHRYIAGPLAPQGRYYVITRTVFAGADHTGRTTPLAHHLVFEREGMIRNGIVPAAAILAALPAFHGHWHEPPRWIDPPRDLDSRGDGSPVAGGATRFANEIALDDATPEIADTLFHYNATKRAVVLVIPTTEAGSVPHVVGRLLSHLPVSVQAALTWASHVVGTTDHVRDAALLVTYPGTEFLDQSKARHDPRAPQIVDLSRGTRIGDRPKGAWATLIAEHRDGGPARIAQLCHDWDRLKLATADAPSFSKAVRAVGRLNQWSAGSDADGVAADLVGLGTHANLANWVSEVAVASVRARVEAGVGGWPSLIELATDPRWPEAARTIAVEMMARSLTDSLPALVRKVPVRSLASSAIHPLLRARVAKDTVALTKVLDQALAGSDVPVDAAAYALELFDGDFDIALGVVDRVLAANPSVSKQLLPAVISFVRRSVKSSTQVEVLCDRTPAADVPIGEYRSELCIPVARHYLSVVRPPDAWARLVDRLIRLSADTASVEAQASWFFKTFQNRADSSTVQQWVTAARDHGPAIIRAANEAGLRVVTAPAPAVSVGPAAIPAEESAALGDWRIPQWLILWRRDGVGPVALVWAAAFAVVAGIFMSMALNWSADRPQGAVVPIARYTVIAWLIAELSIRLVIRSPSHYGVARMFRWFSLIILCVAATAVFWSIRHAPGRRGVQERPPGTVGASGNPSGPLKVGGHQ